jgi:thioredoxin-dependent peroxiredoxin
MDNASLNIALTNDPASSLIGKSVPNFFAVSTSGEFSLSTVAGKTLVLYFYPKDSTPGCTQEAAEFRDAYSDFAAINTIIVGVSRDSLKSHQNFKLKLELPFELISDPSEQLCLMFNVMKMKNMYGKQVRGIERSTFLIDARGVVQQEWRGVKVAKHVQTVLEAAAAVAQKA